MENRCARDIEHNPTAPSATIACMRSQRAVRLFYERDTIRGGEPDAHTVHSGRSLEFTIARLT